MGTVQGKKQSTLYVDPVLHKLIQMIAIKRDVPVYEIVDEAFRMKVEADLNDAERKILGYEKKKAKHGTKNGAAVRPKKARAKTATKPKRDGAAGAKAKARRR